MLKIRIKNPMLKNALEWALALAIALFAFLILENFIIKSARIQGGSMEATYAHGDRVIVNRLAFRFNPPQFGDIIAFPYPANPTQNYIKRVVGTPGDVIHIQNGYIYRNNQRINLPQMAGQGQAFAGTTTFPVVVAENHFFVLGDNLPISEDSRFTTVGTIYKGDIIGRVGFRWFPFNRFGFVQ